MGNLNAEDDTEDLIFGRVSTIQPEESLFPFPEVTPIHEISSPKTLEDCSASVQAAARRLCEEALAQQDAMVGHGSEIVLAACTFDVCFGGDSFAAEDAVLESESEELSAP